MTVAGSAIPEHVFFQGPDVQKEVGVDVAVFGVPKLDPFMFENAPPAAAVV